MPTQRQRQPPPAARQKKPSSLLAASSSSSPHSYDVDETVMIINRLRERELDVYNPLLLLLMEDARRGRGAASSRRNNNNNNHHCCDNHHRRNHHHHNIHHHHHHHNIHHDSSSALHVFKKRQQAEWRRLLVEWMFYVLEHNFHNNNTTTTTTVPSSGGGGGGSTNQACGTVAAAAAAADSVVDHRYDVCDDLLCETTATSSTSTSFCSTSSSKTTSDHAACSCSCSYSSASTTPVVVLQLQHSSVATAAYYLDVCMNQGLCVTPEDHQLAAATCLQLALKAKDVAYLHPTKLVQLGRGSFTQQDVEFMERRLIVDALQWHLHPPTIYDYLRLYEQVLPKSIRPVFHDVVLPALAKIAVLADPTDIREPAASKGTTTTTTTTTTTSISTSTTSDIAHAIMIVAMDVVQDYDEMLLSETAQVRILGRLYKIMAPFDDSGHTVNIVQALHSALEPKQMEILKAAMAVKLTSSVNSGTQQQTAPKCRRHFPQPTIDNDDAPRRSLFKAEVDPLVDNNTNFTTTGSVISEELVNDTYERFSSSTTAAAAGNTRRRRCFDIATVTTAPINENNGNAKYASNSINNNSNNIINNNSNNIISFTFGQCLRSKSMREDIRKQLDSGIAGNTSPRDVMASLQRNRSY